MKIILRDVAYNRGYVVGPYLQERPGVNADLELEEGEDPKECALKALHYLKSITDEFHKQANPHIDHKLPAPGSPLPDIQTIKTSQEDRIFQLVSDINSCREVKVLESYQLMARADSKLQAAYDNRFKQLTDGQ